MKHKNATRKALFTSIISMLLCVSMLVGTTFAWFTDKVESGVNTIAAGNLDVELVHSNKTVTNEPVGGGTKLFKDVDPNLWEPGAVAYENLQVKNVGTLALKYNLNLTVLEETVVNGYKLSDVIKVGVVENGITATDRDAVVNSVSTWTKLSEFSLSMNGKELAAKTNADPIGIVLYWQPNSNEIDNRYNMNNENQGKTLQLDIGVNLLATQLEAESDSFGPDYDEDAVIADTIVTTDEELLAAIQNPEAKVIAIKGNLTYNWGNESYENSKALLMKNKTFIGNSGTADSITFAGYGSANPIVDVTLRNITVKDVTVGDDETAWEHGYLEFEGLVANNVVFADSIMLSGISTLNGCSVDNTVPSWYGVWVEAGDATIKDCSFSGTRAIKIHEAYSSDVNSVVVDDCDFILSEKPGVVIGTVNAATSVSITNSLFVTQAGDQGKYIYESDTDITTFAFTEANNTVPVSAIVIDSEDDLVALGGTKVNGTYVLAADLNMSGKQMKSMELSGGAAVNFIGNGHTISNLSLTAAGIHGMTGAGNEVAGLFDLTAPATTVSLTVNDLTIENATVTNSGYAAAIVGYNPNGGTVITLNDVDVSGATITSDSVAALVGYTTGVVNLTDCDVSGLTLTGEAGRPEKVGAYVGTANTDSCAVVTTNCTNSTTYPDYGRVINGATWNGSSVVSNTDGLKDAIANGATNVTVAQDMTITGSDLTNAASDLTVNVAGGATVTVASGAAASKNVTIAGDKNSKVVLVNTNPGYEGKLSYQDNANLTFKGITFDASQISGICARGGEVVFEDCFVTGELMQTIGSKFVFKGCTFDVGVTQVGYGCTDVVFEGCTFETNGYGIKIYKESNEQVVNLTVKDCSFKNTGTDARSAILLDHILDGYSYNITIEGCTFVGYTATPTATYNKWAERMIVTDSFVKTADGQYIFSYQTGAEGGNYHKILTADKLVVTVK